MIMVSELEEGGMKEGRKEGR